MKENGITDIGTETKHFGGSICMGEDLGSLKELNIPTKNNLSKK